MGIVIVTGAGGFVGGNVVNYLAKRGIGVCAVWHNHRPKDLEESVLLVHADLNDINEIRRELSYEKIGDVDAVIHLAAQLPGACHIGEYLDNTINATRNIVLFSEERKISTFIYTSTIGIYGNTVGEVNENTDRVNLSDYSMAKYIGERITEDADIPERIIIRLPRMVGKGMALNCPWIPSLARKLMQGDEVKYYNPDNYFNQVAHVDSLSDFLITLLENKEQRCITVGIGASQPIRIIEVIEILRGLLESDSKITEIQVKKNDSVNLLNISRAVSVGFHPLTVRETLERMVSNLQENET